MRGDFYFMKNNFYSDFAGCGLMPNKDDSGRTGNRPCFFSFQDAEVADIFWFVPISSKYEKYQDIYNKNITKDYIDCKYTVRGTDVRTDNVTTAKVIQKAKSVLNKSKRGIKLTFTDITKIYNALLSRIK